MILVCPYDFCRVKQFHKYSVQYSAVYCCVNSIRIYPPSGKVDMIIAGAGTGGTVSGIGKKVKEVAPNCKVCIAW